MKRIVISSLLWAGLIVGAIAPAASAGNAHFIKSATSASLDGANLVCNFKEAGLSSGAVETIACTASESVTYECVNGGGSNPGASNKHTSQTTGGASGTFPADQNGNVSGSLTIHPQSAAAVGFTCPPGQTVTLVSVTYSNVRITDATSGASISIPGTFTYTNPSAPPVS
jgi:hypothetical protein